APAPALAGTAPVRREAKASRRILAVQERSVNLETAESRRVRPTALSCSGMRRASLRAGRHRAGRAGVNPPRPVKGNAPLRAPDAMAVRAAIAFRRRRDTYQPARAAVSDSASKSPSSGPRGP